MAPFINQEQAIFFDDESITSDSTTTEIVVSASAQQEECLSPPVTRRSVSFATDVTTHDVLHIDDFTLAEQRSCWYTETEMVNIRRAWKEIVTFIESNVQFDEETTELCTRGLEGKTKDGKRLRRALRNSSIAAVIDEQIYQEMDGEMDHIMIAITYSDCCFQNQKEAFERGCEDYKVARAIHELPVPESNDETDDIDQTKENAAVGPTKFDFESVRSKSFARDGCNGKLVAERNNFNNIFLGGNLRDRFACFLPITPKRYGRRVKNTFR